MNTALQILCFFGSVAIFLLVTDLIRRRKLREEYSLLWFVASLVLLLFSIQRHLLDRLALLVGVAYPPSLLLLGALFFGFLLSMHFSVSLSRLAEQNKRLAQEVALMQHEMERMSGSPGPQ